MSAFTRLKSFNVYIKLPQDLTEAKMSGAIVSIASTLIMLILFITEFNEFLEVQTSSEMFLDINRGGEKLTVNIDLVLPNMVCDIVSLDVQDVIKSDHVNVGGDLIKRRVTKEGKTISEYKQNDGDNHVDLVRAKKAFDEHEGCQILGSFEVNKVPGNFRISAHAYMQALHQYFVDNKVFSIDVSHKINHISFGDDNDLKQIKNKFDKGVLNPLDGVEKIKPEALKDEDFMPQYYISVVPTTYEDLSAKKLYVHQFTAKSNEITAKSNEITAKSNEILTLRALPALYFRYYWSPVTVKYTHHKESFFRFLVQICAIIGGIFTVAGIIDALVHKSVVNIMKKASIGKLG